MEKLKYINKIVPYIDDAFKAFYDGMLSDVKLSVFFENDEQIQKLIGMQKSHFSKTISMRESELKASYIKLGEYHYDIRIPYVDFIKGAQMLEEYFLSHTVKEEESGNIMDDLFIMYPFFSTSKTIFLISPFYDTSGNSFTPSGSKLLTA